jgi:lipopolysaccharide biosynthesis glycosyltransferase
MSARVDIAMGFDAKYAPHAATVVSSIVRNAPGARIRFLMLHADVDAATRGRVATEAPEAEFSWIEVGEKDLPAYATRGHLNRTVLFRLGLETLAPADCTRVIYIDADTIVLGDVRELWGVDLGDCAIGAVRDCYQDAAEFAARWTLPHDGQHYFNAGVQVIDLERVRRERLFSKALNFVVANDEKLLFGDQDALNFVFWGRWAPLDPAWNVQRYLSPAEIATSGWRRAGPGLVHFIGTHKPWMANVWHPWAWLYWENIKRTSFADEIAAAHGIDLYQLMRLRVRWWLRKPPTGRAR